LPLKLYTDQGKPFVNTHARILCATRNFALMRSITGTRLLASDVLPGQISQQSGRPAA